MIASSSLQQDDLPVWRVPERSRRPTDYSLRISEVVSALSHALDLGTGQPVGHSVRSCLLGMRLAEEIGLSSDLRNDLFYASLLKDAGCSTNASQMFHALGSDDIKAKHDVKLTDWTRMGPDTLGFALSHVAPRAPLGRRLAALWRMARISKRHSWEVTKIRCERGAAIARLVGLSETTADAIASLDEHWDGGGYPRGLCKTEIPLLARIMLLAQTLDVFSTARGSDAALAVVQQRSRRWFDPDLIKAALSIASRGMLWRDLKENVYDVTLGMEPNPKEMREDDSTFSAICVAFGQIVDAKSPFTYSHSENVARLAVTIGGRMGLDSRRLSLLRNAGLLHDLGKMGVSNEILEKPGELTSDEWRIMRLHPFYTWKILHAIPRFGEIGEIAGSHHEKLDGSGYFRGLGVGKLSIEARILAVAEVFDALIVTNPYSEGLAPEDALQIVRKEAPHHLDPNCVIALAETLGARS